MTNEWRMTNLQRREPVLGPIFGLGILSSFEIRHSSFSLPPPRDFPVLTKSGLDLGFISQRSIHFVEEREIERHEQPPDQGHHEPLPQGAPADERFFTAGEQDDDREEGNERARAEAQYHLRV